MPLTDWARAASTLLPIKTLSSWKSHQPRSGGQWEYSQLDKIIKWSQTGTRCEHYWSHQHHRHILLASEQNMCHAATPSSNGKYSNCTFLQSFVRSSSSPSNGRCWLTIELFCQYIVKRLQICSNIKGSKLHTSFLTRLIRSTNFCPLLKLCELGSLKLLVQYLGLSRVNIWPEHILCGLSHLRTEKDPNVPDHLNSPWSLS